MTHFWRRALAGIAVLALVAAGNPIGRAGAAETAAPPSGPEGSVPSVTPAPVMPQIPAPGDEQPPADETPPPGASEPTAKPDEEIPVVEYDFSKLPMPVQRLREQIIEAASSGDAEKLRPIIDANGDTPPTFSFDETGDPIEYLKSLSGDPDGREILAILIEILDAGYVHVNVGTPDEVYLWPYFARYPVDRLSPKQLVELFKIIYSGDYEDMKAAGEYLFYRVGIAPDGTWKYFIAGD